VDPSAPAESYRRWWDELFGLSLDRSGLRAESNVLRYRPVANVLVRISQDTPAEDVASLRAAAGVAGVTVEVVDDDDDVLRRLVVSQPERLRLLAPCSESVWAACHEADIAIDDTPVTHHGRVEFPCWLREQAISRTLHRHGRVPG
jgi:RHH-type proline utilization regulon transcriptional repressor/proline dehydrogenase/delta 1-pyrroline-5-carboxylate dehydrogenase